MSEEKSLKFNDEEVDREDSNSKSITLLGRQESNDELKLSERARREVPSHILDYVSNISKYLQDGLELNEACVLANTSITWLNEKIQIYPVIADLLEFIEVSLKRDLLSTLLEKAKMGNDKYAQWFLECRYPETFNKKGVERNAGNNDDNDGVREAVLFVRQRSDPQQIINPQSGKLGNLSNRDLLKQVKDFLR